MAVSSWANQTQWSGATRSANNQDIAPFNDPTTGKTVTLLVKRVPFPIAIEPLQDF